MTQACRSVAVITFVAIILVGLTACRTGGQTAPEEPTSLGNARTLVYKTTSGKRFTVIRDFSMGSSMTGIKVEPSGFSASNEPWDLGFTDPLESVFLADLDGNNYEEIYLVTRSVGSGSYASIHALVSNRDRSATPAYVRMITPQHRQPGQLFEGFMGHNQFMLKNGNLVNEFPVYLDGDTNAQPTGQSKTVTYRLIAGEAGWILEPTGTQP